MYVVVLDLAEALLRLGGVAVAESCYPEAERLLQESLALSRHMRNDMMAAHVLKTLGLVACRQGELATAEERLLESLALYHRSPRRKSWAEGLETLAELRARQQHAEEAVAHYAIADALRAAIVAPMPLGDRPRRTHELASLRAALGPERFATIWEEARRRNVDEGVLELLEPAA